MGAFIINVPANVSLFPRRRESNFVEFRKCLQTWIPACAGMTMLVLFLGIVGNALAQSAPQKFPGVGRAATPAEVAKWDIDVRPDLKGLPKGSGSVARGQQVWEAKCESCHGAFGESNEVFTPIVGGTTKADIESGRVANLRRADFPQRTTLMKLAHLSSLWDYINRAMPWNAPKSLSADDVYAVTAYILHLGDILPADFVLSDANMAQVQNRLPNRNGLQKYTPKWDVRGKGDVTNVACMQNCKQEMKITSNLPDHARDAHGNLAEQHRLIGPVRGADTTKPAPTAPLLARAALPAVAVAPTPRGDPPPAVPSGAALARKHNCTACHAQASKLVGPSYAEVAAKYANDANAVSKMMEKIKIGGSGAWGVIPMPPHPTMTDAELKALAEWALRGGK
ncbi:MAG: c-type cytochrome [Nitrosomonadaceae bacterium]|jgi:cytochrome c|nr:c-type cytochrome [Nitrosomonadaceae bacterium]